MVFTYFSQAFLSVNGIELRGNFGNVGFLVDEYGQQKEQWKGCIYFKGEPPVEVLDSLRPGSSVVITTDFFQNITITITKSKLQKFVSNGLYVEDFEGIS